jgi:hypothetical protein
MAPVKMPKKLGGGAAFLEVPGVYHAAINHVNEQPVTKSGGAIDGWEIGCAVLGGEHDGKQFNLTLYNPRETDTEKQQEGAMARQAALLIASGLATEKDLDGEVDVDLQQMVGRQIVVELDLSQPKNPGDKQFIRLKYDRIYHVDDPRVATAWKSPAAVALIPKPLRRDPKGFDMEKLGGKPSGGASPTGAGSKPAAASAPAVNVDDL